MGLLNFIRETNDRAYNRQFERRQNAQEQAAQKRYAEINKPLFNAIAGDALANPAFAESAASLQSLPPAQATQGLAAMMQQGLANSPTGQAQAAQAAEMADLELQEQRLKVEQMPVEHALKLAQAQRDILAFGEGRVDSMRGEFQKNPVVQKAQTALQSYEQFLNAIEQNNTVALQSAIVALVQVQEPGLAVRNDDRIAYTGNNPMAEQLVQDYNQVITGEVTPDLTRKFIRLATVLAQPWAQSAYDISQDYLGIANRRGLPAEDILIGTGLNTEIMQLLLNAE